ncbi:MAG: hypothetical protein WD273_00440 [Trueperaceae bacterium]
MKRLAFVLVLLLGAALGLAQDDDSQPDITANPVEVRLEIFLVSQVQGSEQFRPATTARPGQVVEYRLTAVNRSEDTLPSGTVEIIGPIPDRTTYVPNSATTSSGRLLTEFSGDGGQNFSEAPVFMGGEAGEDEDDAVGGDDENDRRLVEPEGYDSIRWTLLVALEPDQEEAFFYRVTVD